MTLLTFLIFVISLAVLVLTHEFGHFSAAKRFGIKVLEFGIGLPPRVWGKFVGETIYSVNALPIGGFVRLFGEDETDKQVLNDPRSFAAKPVGQRIAVVVAGVAMNIILAVTLFYIVLGAQGFREKLPLLTPFEFKGAQQTNEFYVYVGEVQPGSPAANAGLKSGDLIRSFNGTRLKSSDQLIDLTKQNAGQTVNLTLVNIQNDQTKEIQVVPRKDPPANEGPLGIRLGPVEIAYLDYSSPIQKAFAGFTHAYNLGTYAGAVFGNLISSAIQTQNIEPVSTSVSGPVGIMDLLKQILDLPNPIIPVLNFVALLSLNLAIINILPFPALDGGRLVFLIFEAVFRRRINPEVEKWIHTVGMAALLVLIVLITFSDIRKLIP